MVAVGGRLWVARGVGGINVEHASERLGLFVRSLGITAPQEQETKTRQVLQRLVEQVLSPG